MPCTEAYREHIMYTFNGYCKTVIRFAAINAWRDRSRRRQKERDYTQREIGEMYGRCRSTTGYQIRRTLRLLHKEMEVLSHGKSEPFAL